MPYCLRVSNPVARKRHLCNLCWVRIEPGQRYNRAVMLGDEGLYEWLMCSECVPVGSLVASWVWWGDGYTEEDAVEWASGHLDDAGHGAIASAYLDRRETALAALRGEQP